jgi:hypothetical protein
MYFLILFSFQFYTYSSYAQSSELGTSSTSPISSPRPVAVDPFLRNHNSNLFCSPPPKRSDCPNYSQVLTSNADDHERTKTLSPNGRPCFVNYDDVSRADTSGALDNPFAVYSTSNPNVFEVDLPIRFDYSNVSGPDKEKQYSDFLKRAQACLDSGQPKITDGTRTLKVRILPLSTELVETNADLYNSSTWISAQVYLHSSYPREDIGNYNLNSDCETISHEILHLLGLHDEYHEEILTYQPSKQAFESELGINLPQSVYDSGLVDQTTDDCRRVAQEPNLMSDTEIFQTGGFKLFQCKLTKDTGTAQEDLTLMQGRSCPASFERIEIGSTNDMSEVDAFYSMAREIVRSERRTTRDLLFYHPITQRDLPQETLRRGQFSQILRPNCMSRPEIRTYLGNARNAYRNRYSAEGGGQCIK